MDILRVQAVSIEYSRITVKYEVFGEISKYFNLEEPFFVDYNNDISKTPQGVAIIPFIVNVLPIIWLTDAHLYIPELDKTFYESIEEIKKGYAEMHKSAEFKGKLHVDNLIDYSQKEAKGCAAFFSGGVDATSTLVSILNQKPLLMTLWGADIKFEDIKGRDNIYRMLEETKTKFNLEGYFIQSSFRRFINESVLNDSFSKIIGDNYWHGLQHGIGLIGHAAPICYKYNLETVYIPGTNSINDPLVSSASHPIIDEKVSFIGCQIIHEGFQFNRQGKVNNIICYQKESLAKLGLRVCWISSGGTNCNRCEKCMRTICGILASGGNPEEYGFEYSQKDMKYIKGYLLYKSNFKSQETIGFWHGIRDEYNINKNSNKDLSWISTFDYNSASNRLRRRLYQSYKQFENYGYRIYCRLFK